MYIGRILEEKPMDMNKFNPLAVAQLATQELDRVTEPRRRQILQNFIEHATAEATGDYERLMASCSQKHQSYRVYGREIDQNSLPQSYKELEKHYYNLIASNIYVLQLDAEKLTVGTDTLMVEGIVHQLMTGEMLEKVVGIEVYDPEGVYQLSKRTAIMFIFDEDGLGCGEHAYTDGPATPERVSKVAPELVPEIFYNNPLTGKSA